MNLREIDPSVQSAIDDAFAAGEWRGRQQADADLVDECVALRVEIAGLRARESRATWMNLGVAGIVLGSWGIFAAVAVWVAS